MRTTLRSAASRSVSFVCLLALLLPLAACTAAVAEIPPSGNTVIYAPGFRPAETEETTAATERETDAPETTAEPKKQDTVLHFLAAGDNIIHASVYEDAHARSADVEANYNFLPMYEEVAPLIAAADIAYVNQEGPMAGIEYGYKGYPNFNAPREAGDTLVELGFDVVNIANNHMLDQWESGLLKTIEYWETKDVLLLGAYRDREDYDNIRVLTCKNGLKIAFLSYTYGTNGMTLTEGSKHVIPLINDSDIVRQIALAREAGDLVFVSMHWGIESSFTVSAEQHRVAKLIADNGADVIIGMHPHVLQPVEWMEGKDGHRTLVTYSIGNLISTMLTANYMVGALLTFDIRVSGETGEITIESPLLIPIMCHYVQYRNGSRGGLQVYLLENYTEELAKAHGAQVNAKFTLSTLYHYVTDNIDRAFLPAFYRDK